MKCSSVNSHSWASLVAPHYRSHVTQFVFTKWSTVWRESEKVSCDFAPAEKKLRFAALQNFLAIFDNSFGLTILVKSQFSKWLVPVSSADNHTPFLASILLRTSKSVCCVFSNAPGHVACTWETKLPTSQYVTPAWSLKSRGIKQAWQAVTVTNLWSLYFEVALV